MITSHPYYSCAALNSGSIISTTKMPPFLSHYSLLRESSTPISPIDVPSTPSSNFRRISSLFKEHSISLRLVLGYSYIRYIFHSSVLNRHCIYIIRGLNETVNHHFRFYLVCRYFSMLYVSLKHLVKHLNRCDIWMWTFFLSTISWRFRNCLETA